MFQKYTDALALMDATIAVNDAVIAANGEFSTWYYTEQGTKLSAPICTAWDKLYTFVHANFPAPVSFGNSPYSDPVKEKYAADVNEMVVMFGKDRATLEEELRKIPPVIAEVAFPVYIARHLLRDQKLAISPARLTTFDEFHQRYGYMIIEGSDLRRK
jgi:hypothetical protein